MKYNNRIDMSDISPQWKIFILLLLIFFTSTISYAEVKPLRTVRVGFFEFEGYQETDENGNRSGYGYEILQRLAPYVRWKYEYIGSGEGWPAMIPMLVEGKCDLVSSAVKTPEKLKICDFSKIPIGYSSVIFTVKKGTNRLKVGDYANWNGIHIGMLKNNSKNDIFEKFAKEKNFSYTPHYFDTCKELELELQSNRLDALVTGNLRRTHNELIYEELDIEPFYFIVKKGNQELLNELDSALHKLELNNPSFFIELKRRYYDLSANDIPYTADELLFLEKVCLEKKVFPVLLNPDAAPFSQRENGRYKGIMKDVFDLLKQRSGLNLQILETRTRQETDKLLRQGDAILIVDGLEDFNESEKLNLYVTTPYLNAFIAKVFRKGEQNDIKSIAAVKPSYIEEYILAREGKGALVVWYDSVAEAVDAVRKGKQDAVYLYSLMAEEIVNNDSSGKLAFHLLLDYSFHFAVGIRNTEDPHLISIISKVINSISSSEMKRIVIANVSVPKVEISFSSWIKNHPFRAIGILTFWGLFIIIGLLILLITRRKTFRDASIMRKLPLFYIVINRHGSVLQYSFPFVTERKKKVNVIYDFLPETVAAQVLNQIAQVFRCKKPGMFNFVDDKGIQRSSDVVRLDDSVFGEDAVLCIFSETAELQKARQDAQELADQLKQTLYSIGDGIIVTDNEGLVRMMNPMAVQLTGYTLNESYGRNHETIFNIRNSYNNQAVKSPIHRVLQYGRKTTSNTDTKLYSKGEESSCYIEEQASPIRGQNDKITGVILVFRDISADYRKREQLRLANEQLELGFALTKSLSFKINPKTMEPEGSMCQQNLWPIEDGKLLPMERWINKEDLAQIHTKLKMLHRGESEKEIFYFRSDWYQVPRYYQSIVSIEKTEFGKILVGVLQDITSITEAAQKLEGVQTLWDRIVNTIPVMIFGKEVDNDFRYMISNTSFEKFTGLSGEKLFGHNDYELKPLAEVAAGFNEQDRQTVQTGSTQVFNEELKDSMGILHNLRTSKQTVTMPNGTRVLLGVTVDISDLCQLQNKLSQTAKNLELTLQSIGDGVIAVDRDGLITLFNPIAETLTGYTAEESINKPIEEIFRIISYETGQTIPSPVYTAIDTGEIVSLANHTDLVPKNVALEDRNGHYHIADSAAPIRDENGIISGAILVFRDVTEEYRKRDELFNIVTGLEYCSDLTKAAYLNVELKSLKVRFKTKNLPGLWPLQDENTLVAYQNFILPEDLSGYEQFVDDIVSHENHVAIHNFRVMYGNEIRFYRARGSIDRSNPNNLCFVGAFQDITDIVNNSIKLEESLSLWHTVINVIPIAFFAKDPDNEYRYVLCNRFYSDFLGLPVDEILGKNDYELMPNDMSRDFIREYDARTIQDGGKKSDIFENVEFLYHGKRYYFRSVRKFYLQPNKKRLLLGAASDYTEQKKLLNIMETTNICLKNFFQDDSIEDAIQNTVEEICHYLQADYISILKINPENNTISSWINYKPAETDYILNVDNIPIEADDDWYGKLQNGEPVILDRCDIENMEMKICHKTRSLILASGIKTICSMKIAVNDHIWGSLTILYIKEITSWDNLDIEFIKNVAGLIEQALKREISRNKVVEAMEVAQKANKAKSDFLASMSHELRTPLNSVIGFADLLKNQNVSTAERIEYTRNISYSGDILLQLINDVLDISKLEAGAMPLCPEKINFVKMCSEFVLGFASRRLKSDLVFEKHLDDSIPQLYLDPIRMRQILLNLIGNAQKFTDRGKIVLEAHFTPDDRENGILRIKVSDTGIGISEQDQKKLFQPFVQANAKIGNRSVKEGTGLGLSIVKHLVVMMGGTISLQSKVGEGSCFTIELPNIPYFTGNGQSCDEINLQTLQEEISCLHSKCKILLVDDYKLNLKIITSLLKDIGLHLYYASSGNEALDIMKKQSIDLVLTDIYMPQMSGIELAEEIKKMDKTIPVVALTKDIISSDNSILFDDILSRPVEKECLYSCLRRILSNDK